MERRCRLGDCNLQNPWPAQSFWMFLHIYASVRYPYEARYVPSKESVAAYDIASNHPLAPTGPPVSSYTLGRPAAQLNNLITAVVQLLVLRFHSVYLLIST